MVMMRQALRILGLLLCICLFTSVSGCFTNVLEGTIVIHNNMSTAAWYSIRGSGGPSFDTSDPEGSGAQPLPPKASTMLPASTSYRALIPFGLPEDFGFDPLSLAAEGADSIEVIVGYGNEWDAAKFNPTKDHFWISLEWDGRRLTVVETKMS
jgi:hypothetical protein